MKRGLVILGIVVTGCAPDPRVAELEGRVAALEARLAGPSETTVPSGSAATAPSPVFDPVAIAGEPGWSLSGGGRDNYGVARDPAQPREGQPSLLLQPTGNPGGKYGTWARSVEASAYTGKRVRFSAFTRTEGTTERADFWARVQAPDSPPDGRGLGGRSLKLPASSDWTRREIVVDVDPQADRLQFGVGIAGPGRMWLHEPKIETVGPEVALTGEYQGEQQVADWLMTGVGAADYALSADGDAGGVRIESKVPDAKKFVAVMRVVPVETLKNKKRFEASLDVSADGLESPGLCIVKAQKERDLAYTGFLRSEKKEVPTTTKGFMPCKLAMDVPDGTRFLLYGFTYRGPGKARVKGGTLTSK